MDKKHPRFKLDDAGEIALVPRFGAGGGGDCDWHAPVPANLFAQIETPSPTHSGGKFR